MGNCSFLHVTVKKLRHGEVNSVAQDTALLSDGARCLAQTLAPEPCMLLVIVESLPLNLGGGPGTCCALGLAAQVPAKNHVLIPEENLFLGTREL